MIRQYLMVYNYHLGISNDKLINQFNEAFRDTSDSSNDLKHLQAENTTEKCEQLHNMKLFSVLNNVK